MKFFCSQCRRDYDVKTFEEFTTKNNLRTAKTNCPVCEMELYRRLDTDYQRESGKKTL